MPIIDVRPVLSASHKLPAKAAQMLADSIARELKVQNGRVWIRLLEIPRANYAENGEVLEDHRLPVFVQVLHADTPDQVIRIQEAQALAAAVAACLGRPIEQVHIEYEPEGRGRVAFGGKLLV
jgi:phenylpyruvate tautomerase PptA (4-oxalocrotonate tautomerase family)